MAIHIIATIAIIIGIFFGGIAAGYYIDTQVLGNYP